MLSDGPQSENKWPSYITSGGGGGRRASCDSLCKCLFALASGKSSKTSSVHLRLVFFSLSLCLAPTALACFSLNKLGLLIVEAAAAAAAAALIGLENLIICSIVFVGGWSLCLLCRRRRRR